MSIALYSIKEKLIKSRGTQKIVISNRQSNIDRKIIKSPNIFFKRKKCQKIGKNCFEKCNINRFRGKS